MTPPPRSPPPGDPGRYVYCQRPRCPKCRCVRILARKTILNQDGSVTRYTTCAECDFKFILVLE